ncbi:MAG: chorismate synthase [Candidatus Limnocylindrus sp.]
MDPANCTRTREEAEASPLRCPDPAAEERMVARIDEAREAGNTVGGIFEVVVKGLPMGLGSYVHWDRRRCFLLCVPHRCAPPCAPLRQGRGNAAGSPPPLRACACSSPDPRQHHRLRR